MMADPLISVIVPVYNAEDLLRRCVDSILAQTFKQIEIILVDDGSIDRSGVICDEYAAEHSGIVAIHQKNQGVSSARNVGIDAARGKYLGFVDSDDWIEPDLYTYLVNCLEQNGTEMSVCGYLVHKGKAAVRNYINIVLPGCMNREEALRSFINSDGVQGFLWNKLFSRELLLRAGNGELLKLNPDIHVCEDLLYSSQCIMATNSTKSIGYVERPMYHYWFHDDSAVSSYNWEKRSSEFLALEKLLIIWGQVSPEHAALIKNKYANVAYRLLRLAGEHGDREHFPVLRGHLRKYLKSYLGTSSVPFTSKISMCCVLCFPNLENRSKFFVKKIIGQK